MRRDERTLEDEMETIIEIKYSDEECTPDYDLVKLNLKHT